MRRLAIIGLCTLLGASPLFAKEKEANRLVEAATVLEEVLNVPDSIPQELLDRAECVIVVPSVKKFAIGFGGSYGRGVMVCRQSNSSMAMLWLKYSSGMNWGLYRSGRTTLMKSSMMISKNNHLSAKEWRHSEFLQEDERFSDKKFRMSL